MMKITNIKYHVFKLKKKLYPQILE